MANVNAIDATLALSRRHMTLLAAKTAIEQLIEDGEVVVRVPTVESEAALMEELAAAGVAARVLTRTPAGAK